MRVLLWLVMAILWVDDCLLLATQWTLVFFCDWLSINQRQIERSLIVLHLALGFYNRIVAGAFWFVWVPLVWTLEYWILYTRPNQIRFFLLFDPRTCVVRFLLAVFLFLIGPFPILFLSNGVRNWSELSYWLVFIAFLYTTSLPRNDPPRGRKRKEALSKLREQFGTSWLPAPSYNQSVTKVHVPS